MLVFHTKNQGSYTEGKFGVDTFKTVTTDDLSNKNERSVDWASECSVGRRKCQCQGDIK